MTLKYHYAAIIAPFVFLSGISHTVLAQTAQPSAPSTQAAPTTSVSSTAAIPPASLNSSTSLPADKTSLNSNIISPITAPVTAPIVTPQVSAITPAPASSSDATANAVVPFTASSAYKDCTALASSNPEQALNKASEWLKIDDSVAAHHCRAMALYGLKQYDAAGAELDIVRAKIDVAQISLRSYVARQGARAWVDANKPQNALNILTEQINDMTQNRGDNATQAQLTTDLLLDRGRVREQYGQLSEAVQDFDQAVSLSPSNEEVLIERAKVFSQLGDSGLAQRDLQVVLRFNPGNKQAQGLMRVLRDIEAAKKL